MEKRKPSLEEAIIKIRTFCNYRDRCHKEVRDKLYSMGLWKKDVEHALTQMIDENLLNEERYARSFARGYFNTKRWGKYKITVELRQRRIHERLIALALTEIDDDDYQNAILHLIEKKSSALQKGTLAERQQKVSNYLLQKGYSYQDFGALVKEKVKR